MKHVVVNQKWALSHLSDIVAVEDVDVIFIGPTDLSQSLGYVGNPQHPHVRAAIDKVVEAVRTAPPALSTFVGNAAIAREWQDRGARYIATSFEAVLKPAMVEYLIAIRDQS